MPGYEEMMQQGGGAAPAAGGEQPYYSASAYKGAESGHRQRVMDLYSQLDQINQQYGQAAELPDHVVDKIHVLSDHLDQAINQWEEYKGKARSATKDMSVAQEQNKMAQSYKPLIQGGRAPAGQMNAPIADRLEQAAGGMRSNTTPQAPQQGRPQPPQRRPTQESPVGPYADMLKRKGPQPGFSFQ